MSPFLVAFEYVANRGLKMLAMVSKRNFSGKVEGGTFDSS